jgi:hypothetical protein
LRIDSLAPFPNTSLTHTEALAPSRDPAFAARPRLKFLRHSLAAEARKALRRAKPGVPPLFFFDPARQAEFEAARDIGTARRPDPVEALIGETLPQLFASIEARRVARAIPGLKEAAHALASKSRGARDLADLLAMPDDETVLVLHPTRRAGYRLLVRGIADAAQFHVLLAGAITGHPGDGFLPGPMMPARFITACREANPMLPAGVPTVSNLPWQLFRPAALTGDGRLPQGFHGCPHWIWGREALASVPRVDGERVLLLGEPTIGTAWEVERRFPAMPAELRLLEVLGPFVVAGHLSRLAGQAVPVRSASEQPRPESAKAA